MQPSKKLIILIGVGIVLTVISSILYQNLFVFIAYNVLISIVVAVDYFMTKENFSIGRDKEVKLSLYAEEEIGFIVYNKGNSPLYIDIKDTHFPFSFNRLTEYASGIIEPHEKELITYKIEPKKRGIYVLKNIYVRFQSRYGLIYKYKSYELPCEVKVYPNIKDLRRYRLMVHEGYIMRGAKRVNVRGSGLEFESLREYTQGDSYKKINWQATASQSKPIVNQYEAEKNQDVMVLVDSGKAMSYEIRGYKKLDLAINTAVILSDIANMTGDKSGLLVFNRDVQQFIKPGKGSKHRNTFLEALYTIHDSRYTSNFFDAFFYLNKEQKKRSLVFVFTEFETMDETDDYLRILPQIARRHLVILFMMRKEKVTALTTTHSKKDKDIFVKGAAIKILAEREEIIKKLRRSGIMCVECLPESLTMEVINYYIQLKRH